MKRAAPQSKPRENSRLLGDPWGPRGVATPSPAYVASARREAPLAAALSPGDPRDALAGEGLGLEGKFPRAEQAGRKLTHTRESQCGNGNSACLDIASRYFPSSHTSWSWPEKRETFR